MAFSYETPMIVTTMINKNNEAWLVVQYYAMGFSFAELQMICAW